MIGSQIDQAGETTRDSGVTIWIKYEMDQGWRQQWIGMHFGNELQINDAGYLSRNSTNYAHWEVNRRFTDLPEESRYSSKEWRWRASTNYNDHGRAAESTSSGSAGRVGWATAVTSTRSSTSTAPASTTC